MAFLGLELGVGLSAAVALAVLAVLWDYGSLIDVEWEEITAGVMLFVAAAGLNLFAGSNALAAYTSSAAQINTYLVPIVNLLGGLLVLFGALRNSWQVLQQRM
ncbi:MAG: hypothetical protein MUP63_04300 [Candidatus Nanohaloarchaeota archaeon QJJ-7]|nr:hypothetical protein [Candidatus Nanohaloarchaeota archaeon QJJ-7]